MEDLRSIEESLPRDMVNEILGRLTDQELFVYGMASKRCLESTEYIWKQRLENLDDKTVSLTHLPSLSWYLRYINQSKEIFVNKLLEDIKNFETLDNALDKKLFLEKTYSYIFSNISIISRKSMLRLRITMKDKLHDFIESFCKYENELAQKYYPLIFPTEYNQYLITKYLYEDDEEREDPDYV